jgi:tyrosine-protein phosphatase SIW14
MHKALHILLNTQNHPILIHDDSGKSTSSLLVSLIRRLQGWSLTGVFAEGDMFAGPAGGAEGSGVGEAGREVSVRLSSRGIGADHDVQFIALFNPKTIIKSIENRPAWLG